MIDGWGVSCKIALRWMSPALTGEKSTMVQVMAWCRQATSHYLSQCWPKSMLLYGITRPQYVNYTKLYIGFMPSVRLSHIPCPLCNSYSSGWILFHIRHKWSLTREGVSRIMTFDLDLYLQGHSAMTFQKTAKIWHVLSCPFYSTYSSGLILSILSTNDH